MTVSLLRPEHDPRVLLTPTNGWVWAGQKMVYTSRWDYEWQDVPAPQGGEQVRPGVLDMRRNHSFETPDYVEVPHTQAGDYCGDTYNKSNCRALLRDYPDTFVHVVTDHDSDWLLLPLNTAVDELLLERLVHLRDEYPVYDDDDHSAYEMELADEAWDQWLKADVYSELEKAGVDTLAFSDERDQQVRDLFYRLTSEQPEGPHGEGGCGTSVTFPYQTETVAAIVLALQAPLLCDVCHEPA